MQLVGNELAPRFQLRICAFPHACVRLLQGATGLQPARVYGMLHTACEIPLAHVRKVSFMSNAARAHDAAKPSLAEQVRDTLVLNEGLVVEVVNEVLSSLAPHRAEFFRRALKNNVAMGVAIKRAVVDVGVVLALAKSFDSDDEFSDSAGLIHDIDFGAHDGNVGQFAKAMVECDLQAVAKAHAGEASEDAVYFDLIPPKVLERRLQLLLAFINEVIKKAH